MCQDQLTFQIMHIGDQTRREPRKTPALLSLSSQLTASISCV